MPKPPQTPLLDFVSRQFRAFADECRESSPLYERFAANIGDDPEILALAAHARRGERVPNLLFAAVQFLLLKGTPHPLAGFYETHSTSAGDPYPPFRNFCLHHAERIIELMANRTVQTNEVSRCALLLPSFVLVSRGAEGRPLYLLEIGAAAGLILLWDRYGYDYGNGLRSGDAASPVQITCELRGTSIPDVPTTLPAVERRIGVDLNPIDVDDTEQTLWLRSLVWPEDGKRARLLENAVAVARRNKPDLPERCQERGRAGELREPRQVAGVAERELTRHLLQDPTDREHCAVKQEQARGVGKDRVQQRAFDGEEAAERR